MTTAAMGHGSVSRAIYTIKKPAWRTLCSRVRGVAAGSLGKAAE